MFFREVSPTGLRGALLGFVEGAVIVCVVLVGWLMYSGDAPGVAHVPLIVSLSVAGGLMLAIGRGISGRLLGAGAGAMVGVLVCLPVTSILPQSWDIEQSEAKPFALAGPTLDGKKIDIAEYRGKIVLVDFWATWCGPCVQELPNVLQTYDRYHARGFEVIAVSLDTEQGQLADFVERRHLPWPQIIFDRPQDRGWTSPLAREHGVKSIPATFLIDREGKLIARDLPGAKLIDEVGRHLDPEKNGKPRFGRTATRVIPIRLYIGCGCGLLVGAMLGAMIQRRAMRGGPS